MEGTTNPAPERSRWFTILVNELVELIDKIEEHLELEEQADMIDELEQAASVLEEDVWHATLAVEAAAEPLSW